MRVIMGFLAIVLKHITPRKGTVTDFIPGKLGIRQETTHTPQGDGNMVRVTILCLAIIETTHTP